MKNVFHNSKQNNIQHRIKIFTADSQPNDYNGEGNDITKRMDKWIDSFSNGIEILSIQNTTSEYLTVFTIVYTIPLIPGFDAKEK